MHNMYAQVALGLPLRKLFDYSIPNQLSNLRVGARVKVPFRNSILIGYVLKVSKDTDFGDKIKPIDSILDSQPILNDKILALAKSISDNYCCSLGEAIETILPKSVRHGGKIKFSDSESIRKVYSLDPEIPIKLSNKPAVISCFNDEKRLKMYFIAMQAILNQGESVILIVPDQFRLKMVYEEAKKAFSESIAVLSTTLKESENSKQWERIFNRQVRIVIGTRVAVFAPLANLGLIVIEDESNDSYRQEEKPYYQVRDIAVLRSKIEGTKLLLGSCALSVEMFYKVSTHNFDQIKSENDFKAKIQIVDLKGLGIQKSLYISKPLEVAMRQTIDKNESVVLFFNRRGAGVSICSACGKILKCGKCDSYLVFDRYSKFMQCHHCNFKIKMPDFCPQCKKGYLIHQGTGAQKIENRLFSLFPEKRIVLAEQNETPKKEFDILIGTQKIFSDISSAKVSFSAILSLDAMLNVTNFRSTEKAFNVITKLLSFTENKLMIQTYNAEHYLIRSLVSNDFRSFYQSELKLRKDLNLPPFAHILEIQFRDKNESKLVSAITEFHNEFKNFLTSEIRIVGPVVDEPYKLRNNYRQKLIIKSKTRENLLLLLYKIYDNLKKIGVTTAIMID